MNRLNYIWHGSTVDVICDSDKIATATRCKGGLILRYKGGTGEKRREELFESMSELRSVIGKRYEIPIEELKFDNPKEESFHPAVAQLRADLAERTEFANQQIGVIRDTITGRDLALSALEMLYRAFDSEPIFPGSPKASAMEYALFVLNSERRI